MATESSKFSLGTVNHDVFVLRNLVDLYKVKTTSSISTKEDLLNIVASSEVLEFDLDLYNDAISLPEAESLSFSFDTKSYGKYKFGQFVGRNIYKDGTSGIIDSSLERQTSMNGWLTQDNSSSEYCLFTSSSSNESFYIAIKDYRPGLIISDFSPLYIKLMNLQLNKYFLPKPDIRQSGSLSASYKNIISEKINLSKNGSVLSLNSVVASKYYSVKNVIDEAYKSLPQLSKIHEFGKFKADSSDEDIAVAMLSEAPIASEVKSLGLIIYDTIKSFVNDSDNIKANFNKGNNYDKAVIVSSIAGSVARTGINTLIKSIEYVPDLQAIVYATPPVTSNNGTYDFNNAIDMLGCLQTPEQISYSVDASYESQSPRGSQVPYQFYQSNNQISLSFELKWHIDEVRDLNLSQLLSNKGKTLQAVADMAESFSRPWDNGHGSLQPKLCRVLLPSISEVGYISNVSISYSGDMTNSGDNATDKATISDLQATDFIESSDVYHAASDYTYNQLTISFTLLVVRDVKLSKGDKVIALDLNNSYMSSTTSITDIYKNPAY